MAAVLNQLTLSSLCEGTLVLETQQSSDTTYRVYDYDRRDTDGNLRDLHLEKAIDVTTVPHQEAGVAPVMDEGSEYLGLVLSSRNLIVGILLENIDICIL